MKSSINRADRAVSGTPKSLPILYDIQEEAKLTNVPLTLISRHSYQTATSKAMLEKGFGILGKSLIRPGPLHWNLLRGVKLFETRTDVEIAGITDERNGPSRSL